MPDVHKIYMYIVILLNSFLFTEGEYGFLKEQRRSNVAVTRARRHLCLIGDSDTVSHEPFMKGMIDYCHQNAEVWSAHEYLQGVPS